MESIKKLDKVLSDEEMSKKPALIIGKAALYYNDLIKTLEHESDIEILVFDKETANYIDKVIYEDEEHVRIGFTIVDQGSPIAEFIKEQNIDSFCIADVDVLQIYYGAREGYFYEEKYMEYFKANYIHSFLLEKVGQLPQTFKEVKAAERAYHFSKHKDMLYKVSTNIYEPLSEKLYLKVSNWLTPISTRCYNTYTNELQSEKFRGLPDEKKIHCILELAYVHAYNSLIKKHKFEKLSNSLLKNAFRYSLTYMAARCNPFSIRWYLKENFHVIANHFNSNTFKKLL